MDGPMQHPVATMGWKYVTAGVLVYVLYGAVTVQNTNSTRHP